MDWIALAGLLLAIASLGWQITNWARSRPTLVVTTSVVTSATAHGRDIVNECQVMITVHALHGAVGVVGIDWAVAPFRAHSITAVELVPGVRPRIDIDLGLDVPPVDAGTTVTWRYRVRNPDGTSFRNKATVTPTVLLGNGRRVPGQPVEIYPDMVVPNSGWRPPTHYLE